jgi:UDP-N-acetylmuramate dehydrogenase
MRSLAEAFPAVTKQNEPLASHTHLRIGGPAEFFVQPRSVEELAGVLAFCQTSKVPLRMLGGGYNLLVRDEAVPGAVMRLAGPAFAFVEGTGRTIRAGGGGQLFDLVAFAVRAGLRGLEALAGIRGTVGGSVRCNVGDRSGEIAAAVRKVAVLTDAGTVQIRGRDDLSFGDHSSDLDEPVILWVEFELDSDAPAALLRRMRKAWAIRKAHEPLSFQAAVRVFRDPPGQLAATLIDRAGLAKARVGGAEVCERNGSYVVAHPGTTATDILQLAAKIETKVKVVTGVALDRELNVW